MTMGTEEDLQTDHGWDNRRLILASLAPRPATRPARRAAATDDVADERPDDAPKKPGLLTRGLQASGRAARAGAHQFNKRVPPNRRMHTAIITAAAVVVLLVALAGVNYLLADVNPHVEPHNFGRGPTATAATGAAATRHNSRQDHRYRCLPARPQLQRRQPGLRRRLQHRLDLHPRQEPGRPDPPSRLRPPGDADPNPSDRRIRRHRPRRHRPVVQAPHCHPT